MTSDDRHSVAVAAVIFDDEGRALLMKRRDHDNWEPPGGVLKLKESLTDGVRREVKEETGLEIEPSYVTGIYKNTSKDVLTVAFRCEVKSGRAQPTEEAAAVRWVEEDAWPDHLNRDYLAWARDARDGSGVPVRDQTATIKGASESPR